MRRSGATLRIGTRSSPLALWQTEHVRTLLRTIGQETEPVEIKTTGDIAVDVPLARIGSRALFTKQIDDALLEGRIDLAVHSLKDLSTELPSGLMIGAVGKREDPRDALVGRGALSWSELPHGAVVATSSVRRRAQLLNLRPDLRVEDVRGNVDTRLAKLDARTDWTAIVLAAAGLIRLGLGQRIGERLSPSIMMPAPGQGALAVTVRIDDPSVESAVRRAMHDRSSGVAVAAERAFLHRLEGGCQVPVGAFAELEATGGRARIRLVGRVVSLDGQTSVEGEEVGAAGDESAAASLGEVLAERLLAQGGAAILTQARSAAAPAVTEP